MIRFCEHPDSGRGFPDTKPPRKGETPQTLCPTCRRGMAPLSTRIGGADQAVGIDVRGNVDGAKG